MKYNEKILNLIKEIVEERKVQDKRCTREPIYLVQSRRERAIDTRYDTTDVQRIKIPEISVDGFLPTFEDIKNGELRQTPLPCELVMELEECESIEDMFERFEEYFFEDDEYYGAELINAEYYWETVAYFLTEQDAKDYQEYQSHNLGVSRTFVVSPGYNNSGKFDRLLNLLDNEDFIID